MQGQEDETSKDKEKGKVRGDMKKKKDFNLFVNIQLVGNSADRQPLRGTADGMHIDVAVPDAAAIVWAGTMYVRAVCQCRTPVALDS